MSSSPPIPNYPTSTNQNENKNSNDENISTTINNNTIQFNDISSDQAHYSNVNMNRRTDRYSLPNLSRIDESPLPHSINDNTTRVIYPSNHSFDKSIKIPQPRFFTGEAPVTAMMVQSFIRGMNRYLEAVNIDINTIESKRISARYLDKHALMWFDYVEEKTIVSSWKL
jgi:hypothetical protein